MNDQEKQFNMGDEVFQKSSILQYLIDSRPAPRPLRVVGIREDDNGFKYQITLGGSLYKADMLLPTAEYKQYTIGELTNLIHRVCAA